MRILTATGSSVLIDDFATGWSGLPNPQPILIDKIGIDHNGRDAAIIHLAGRTDSVRRRRFRSQFA